MESQVRTRINGKQNAKGQWQLDITYERVVQDKLDPEILSEEWLKLVQQVEKDLKNDKRTIASEASS